MLALGLLNANFSLVVLMKVYLILSLGSSPHPSTPDEDDSQTELLIAEEKLSPEDEGQVMPRYEHFWYRCEDFYPGWSQTLVYLGT